MWALGFPDNSKVVGLLMVLLLLLTLGIFANMRYSWLINVASVDLMVGITDKDQTKLKNATETFRQALELAPPQANTASASLGLGRALLLLNDLDTGKDILLGISSEGHYRIGSALLGQELARRGRIEEAVDVFVKLRATVPMMELVSQLADQGNKEQAAAIWYEAYLLWKTMSQAGGLLPSVEIRRTASRLALRFIRQRDYTKAIEIYLHTIEIGSATAATYREIGTTYARAKDYQQAEYWLDEAIRRAPNNFLINLERGRLARRIGQHEDAMAYLAKAFAVAPMKYKGRTAAEIGSLYQDMGHLVDASEWYATAVDLEPERIEYRLSLAQILVDSQRHDDAIQQYQAIIEIAPNNQQAAEALELLNVR